MHPDVGCACLGTARAVLPQLRLHGGCFTGTVASVPFGPPSLAAGASLGRPTPACVRGPGSVGSGGPAGARTHACTRTGGKT